MPEDKFSDLRLRLEKLEALLQDAVLDEGDNLGSRLETLTGPNMGSGRTLV